MLRITGGKVYDPANGINGEVRDICIADGKIVAAVEGGRTLDATGMIVFPGDVRVNVHTAGKHDHSRRVERPATFDSSDDLAVRNADVPHFTIDAVGRVIDLSASDPQHVVSFFWSAVIHHRFGLRRSRFLGRIIMAKRKWLRHEGKRR